MQIRPGVTLLQAIARSAEARPTPFADRLADLETGAATGAKPAAAPSAATTAAASGAAPPRVDAAAPSQGAATPFKPRGSVLNIVV